MINLLCPNCSTELEIDDGFRGGVCRCFSCGTLMTVPADPNQEAQQLSRQERPARPDEPGGTYETAAGETVAITDEQLEAIPVAGRRRYGVRATVIVIFLLIVGALIAGIVVGVQTMLSQQEGPTAGEIAETSLGYDPEANPFLTDMPNFMGLPLGERTIMMTDGSAAMRDWYGLVSEAMIAGARSLKPEQRTQGVIWREPTPVAYPRDSMRPRSEISLRIMRRRLEEIYAGGGMEAVPAFRKAIDSSPAKIIVTVNMPPMPDTIDQVKQMLINAGVTVDVVGLSTSAKPMEVWAEATDGMYIQLPGGQLRQWFDAYLDTRYDQDLEADEQEAVEAPEQDQEAEAEPAAEDAPTDGNGDTQAADEPVDTPAKEVEPSEPAP